MSSRKSANRHVQTCETVWREISDPEFYDVVVRSSSLWCDNTCCAIRKRELYHAPSQQALRDRICHGGLGSIEWSLRWWESDAGTVWGFSRLLGFHQPCLDISEPKLGAPRLLLAVPAVKYRKWTRIMVQV